MNKEKTSEFSKKIFDFILRAKRERTRLRKLKHRRAYAHWNGYVQGLEQFMKIFDEVFNGPDPEFSIKYELFQNLNRLIIEVERLAADAKNYGRVLEKYRS